eukprot:gnl/Dysnectes_brevis/6766_a10743_242.p1 GENE.gnl/Dysnectes_brevis/6766_a10743_242~~gnl/Dysnectes_brevis/6766_a10743_242.p1  ORF type:complete len:1223 (+),score=327.23 gnl/Dysnectes_brevis/6766_a10743_242:500-3670(+)
METEMDGISVTSLTSREPSSQAPVDCLDQCLFVPTADPTGLRSTLSSVSTQQLLCDRGVRDTDSPLEALDVVIREMLTATAVSPSESSYISTPGPSTRFPQHVTRLDDDIEEVHPGEADPATADPSSICLGADRGHLLHLLLHEWAGHALVVTSPATHAATVATLKQGAEQSQSRPDSPFSSSSFQLREPDLIESGVPGDEGDIEEVYLTTEGPNRGVYILPLARIWQLRALRELFPSERLFPDSIVNQRQHPLLVIQTGIDVAFSPATIPSAMPNGGADTLILRLLSRGGPEEGLVCPSHHDDAIESIYQQWIEGLPASQSDLNLQWADLESTDLQPPINGLSHPKPRTLLQWGAPALLVDGSSRTIDQTLLSALGGLAMGETRAKRPKELLRAVLGRKVQPKAPVSARPAPTTHKETDLTVLTISGDVCPAAVGLPAMSMPSAPLQLPRAIQATADKMRTAVISGSKYPFERQREWLPPAPPQCWEIGMARLALGKSLATVSTTPLTGCSGSGSRPLTASSFTNASSSQHNHNHVSSHHLNSTLMSDIISRDLSVVIRHICPTRSLRRYSISDDIIASSLHPLKPRSHLGRPLPAEIRELVRIHKADEDDSAPGPNRSKKAKAPPLNVFWRRLYAQASLGETHGARWRGELVGPIEFDASDVDEPSEEEPLLDQSTSGAGATGIGGGAYGSQADSGSAFVYTSDGSVVRGLRSRSEGPGADEAGGPSPAAFSVSCRMLNCTYTPMPYLARRHVLYMPSVVLVPAPELEHYLMGMRGGENGLDITAVMGRQGQPGNFLSPAAAEAARLGRRRARRSLASLSTCPSPGLLYRAFGDCGVLEPNLCCVFNVSPATGQPFSEPFKPSATPTMPTNEQLLGITRSVDEQLRVQCTDDTVNALWAKFEGLGTPKQRSALHTLLLRHGIGLGPTPCSQLQLCLERCGHHHILSKVRPAVVMQGLVLLVQCIALLGIQTAQWPGESGASRSKMHSSSFPHNPKDSYSRLVFLRLVHAKLESVRPGTPSFEGQGQLTGSHPTKKVTTTAGHVVMQQQQQQQQQ